MRHKFDKVLVIGVGFFEDSFDCSGNNKSLDSFSAWVYVVEGGRLVVKRV